jgi:hypothetical protein
MLSHGPCDTCEQLAAAVLTAGPAINYVKENQMQKYPRRRDVRDTCERVFAALSDQLNDSAEFGRLFLTDLRNLLRDGISFEHAVLSFEVMPAAEEPVVAEPIDQPVNSFQHFPSKLGLS